MDEDIELLAGRPVIMEEAMPPVAAMNPSGGPDSSNVTERRRMRLLMDDDAVGRGATGLRPSSWLGLRVASLVSSPTAGNGSMLFGVAIFRERMNQCMTNLEEGKIGQMARQQKDPFQSLFCSVGRIISR